MNFTGGCTETDTEWNENFCGPGQRCRNSEGGNQSPNLEHLDQIGGVRCGTKTSTSREALQTWIVWRLSCCSLCMTTDMGCIQTFVPSWFLGSLDCCTLEKLFALTHYGVSHLFHVFHLRVSHFTVRACCLLRPCVPHQRAV